jgi:putative peptidoglycan lipid II flippase
MLPLGVFAMSISTAIFPTLAEHGALDKMAELRRTMVAALRLILYLTIPSSVGLIVLGEPIIRLLLQNGAFTAEATRATAYALGFFAIGLTGHATVEIVNRVFYSLHDTRTPVAVAAVAFLVNVTLSLVLMNYLSFGGLALANAIAALVEAAILAVILSRRLEGVQLRTLALPLVVFTAWALIQGLVAGAVAGYTETFLDIDSVLGRLLQVGLAIGAGGLVYAGLSYAMRSRELMLMVGMVTARLGRRAGQS